MREDQYKRVSETIKRLHAQGKYDYKHMQGNKFRLGLKPWNKDKKVGVKTATSFKKGDIPWNKGRPGYSTTKKGKKFPNVSGAKHWNWRGNKTSEVRRARNSSEYKVWRASVFMRDNYTCVLCNKRGGYLEADHIKQFAHYPSLRYEIKNGRTLCKECHHRQPIYSYGGKVKFVRLK